MKKDDLLLIVDMQNVYARGGKWECLDTEGAAQNLQKIIAHGLKNVIFTRFIANETSPKGVWADYNKKYSDVNSDFYANQMLKEFEPSLKKFPLYKKRLFFACNSGSFRSLQKSRTRRYWRSCCRMLRFVHCFFLN